MTREGEAEAGGGKEEEIRGGGKSLQGAVAGGETLERKGEAEGF
jgi:hypothetical protein